MLDGHETYSNLEEVYKSIQLVLDKMKNVKVYAGGEKFMKVMSVCFATNSSELTLLTNCHRR